MSGELDQFECPNLEALLDMLEGDFSTVAAMLREGAPIGSEVSALLAEFLTGGNARGRLKFVRPRGKPRISFSDKVYDGLLTFYEVEEQKEHSGLGVEDVMRNIAANGSPARSYEAVRDKYYKWRKILAKIDEDEGLSESAGYDRWKKMAMKYPRPQVRDK